MLEIYNIYTSLQNSYNSISHPVFYAANIRRPGISDLQRQCLTRVQIHTLVERSLGDSFLVPREIHVRSV